MLNTLQISRTRELVLLSSIEPPQTNAKNRVAKSIALFGLLDSIKVKRIDDSRYQYRILDGERRYETLVALGETQIEVDIIAGDTDATLDAVTAVSNLCRSRNHVKEAQALQRIGSVTANLEMIAEATGMSQHVIKASLKLANLPLDILECIGSSLSVGTARHISQLEMSEQEHVFTSIRKLEVGTRFTNQMFKTALHELKPHQPSENQNVMLEPAFENIINAIISSDQLNQLKNAGFSITDSRTLRA